MKVESPATIWIQEYSDRMLYKKLGIVSQVGEISELDLECFRIISNEISKLEDQELKKKTK